MKSEVSKRLFEFLDNQGLSVYRVTKDTSIADSTIRMWKKGLANPKYENIKKICDTYGIDINYFYDEEGNETTINTNKIPVLGIVPCGVPIEAIEDVKEYIDVIPSMSKNHFGLIAKGDSMFPYIQNGDILVVKQTKEVKSGKIAIVKVNGDEATCKKIILGNGITLVPLNVSYNPKSYSEEDITKKPVTIIGEVVEIRRRLK